MHSEGCSAWFVYVCVYVNIIGKQSCLSVVRGGGGNKREQLCPYLRITLSCIYFNVCTGQIGWGDTCPLCPPPPPPPPNCYAYGLTMTCYKAIYTTHPEYWAEATVHVYLSTVHKSNIHYP